MVLKHATNVWFSDNSIYLDIGYCQDEMLSSHCLFDFYKSPEINSYKSSLQINILFSRCILRERPFNLKGGYVFFLKKYSNSQCYWKNILILVEEKKKFGSEFLSYNLMLNSGKKIRARQKK